MVKIINMAFKKSFMMMMLITVILSCCCMCEGRNANNLNTVIPRDLTATIIPTTRQQQYRGRRRRDSFSLFELDIVKLRSFENTTDVLTKSHWKRDSSYTKSWTDEDWKSHQMKSFRRYVRHTKSWIASPTFISVLPTVLATLLWTIICMISVSKFQHIQQFVSRAPFSTSISSFTSPISILLALKINRALNRLLEARNMFGLIVRVVTAITGMVVNYIYVPVDKRLGLLMGRYLAAFTWCVKGLLRGEDDSIVLETLLPPDEAAWVKSHPDSPSAIIFRLRSIIAHLTLRGKLPTSITKAMEDKIADLERALGVCKRIKGT
jgi:hypothetical protein